jgi:hypothetical protein
MIKEESNMTEIRWLTANLRILHSRRLESVVRSVKNQKQDRWTETVPLPVLILLGQFYY